jgi:excisionase family DNA binding protein
VTGTLLTARHVGDLLDVDASTVYRMAGDGRLPAVRIGRQWRFPADAIDRLLAPAPAAAGPATPADDAPPVSALLPPVLTTAVVDAVAHALGVSMAVVDLGGRTLTPVVNPAPAFAARLEAPAFLEACASSWRSHAAEPELVPRFRPSVNGSLCANGWVRHGPHLVAMVLAGGVSPAPPDRAVADGLFHLDDDARRRVLDTLPRVAVALSRLAETSAG